MRRLPVLLVLLGAHDAARTADAGNRRTEFNLIDR
jgi:hypothetical protein